MVHKVVLIYTKNSILQGENLEEKPKANVHLLDETLFINSFSDEDNGEYSCVVTNQAGTTTSNGVQLYISGNFIYIKLKLCHFAVVYLILHQQTFCLFNSFYLKLLVGMQRGN